MACSPLRYSCTFFCRLYPPNRLWSFCVSLIYLSNTEFLLVTSYNSNTDKVLSFAPLLGTVNVANFSQNSKQYNMRTFGLEPLSASRFRTRGKRDLNCFLSRIQTKVSSSMVLKGFWKLCIHHWEKSCKHSVGPSFPETTRSFEEMGCVSGRSTQLAPA